MMKIKKPAQPNIPVEEALKIVRDAHQQKIDKAWAKIQAVLDEEGLQIKVMNNIILLPK